MESVNGIDLIVALAIGCVGCTFGLYLAIESLRHNLHIIKTKQCRRPRSERLVTGRIALWIGAIRTCVAGLLLAGILGAIFYILRSLGVTALW